MLKVKSFSFKEEYFKEYWYVFNMKNASEYVCELIRADMKKQAGLSPQEIEAEIKSLEEQLHRLRVDAYLNKKNLQDFKKL